MKKINYILFFLLIATTMFTACDKSENFEYSFQKAVFDDIDSVAIKVNHTTLLLDGKSELDLDLSLHQFYDYVDFKGDTIKRSRILIESRLEKGDIKYFYQYEGKEPVEIGSRTFIGDKGTDENKAYVFADVLGKQSIKTEIKLKKFAIDNNLYSEKTIPVIFHALESSELNNTDFRIGQEHVMAKFTEINNAYQRLVNQSPNGFDTKLKFVPAQFGPDGSKLKIPGLNIIQLSEETVEEEYDEMTDGKDFDFNDYIKKKNLVWDYTQYFNIWVISSKGELDLDFLPKHVLTGKNTLPGLDMVEVNEGDPILSLALDVGAVVFYNEFVQLPFGKLAGTWLGLLDTGYEGRVPPAIDTDYCDDTFVYSIDIQGTSIAKKDVFTDFRYQSTNIMDKKSMNTVVTFEQGKRILHVLNNCPTRMCWKSSHALGK
jgi:hypothetical protein